MKTAFSIRTSEGLQYTHYIRTLVYALQLAFSIRTAEDLQYTH